jgi:hypothetical protein
MADRTVTTDLIARDRMSQAYDKAGKSAEKNGGIIGKVGKGIGVGLKAGAVAAGGGLLALGGWMAQGVKDAVSYQTVLAKTAQVLKTTGGASGQTVDGIKNQAAALETLSGVDEELIINSQNVLATFTNIRNVGKDKIFDEATKSALDMSVALGSDLQGASIQVGKALNDPIKGVGALSKVGVTFSESQKKTIAAMVKTGDTAGAQSVILKELNKEFGGAAKAAGAGAAGDWARFQDVISDTGRTVGQELLPTLTKVLVWATNKLPGAIDTATQAIEGFMAALKGQTGATDAGIVGKAEQAGIKVAQAFRIAKTVIGDFIAVISNPEVQAFAGAIAAIVTVMTIYEGTMAVVTAVTTGWTAAQAALDVVLTANPIGLVIVGVVALTAAIVILWKRSETFRGVMITVFKAVSNVVLTAASVILDIFGSIASVLGHLPGKAGAAFRSMGHAIDSAKGKVDALHNRINNLPTHKSININVTTHYGHTGSAADGVGGNVPKMMARGGAVTANTPYIVGEHQAELFVPGQSGTIIPDIGSLARKTSGGSDGTQASASKGGTVVYVTVNAGTVVTTAQGLADAVVDAFNRRAAGSRKLSAEAVAAAQGLGAARGAARRGLR